MLLHLHSTFCSPSITPKKSGPNRRPGHNFVERSPCRKDFFALPGAGDLFRKPGDKPAVVVPPPAAALSPSSTRHNRRHYSSGSQRSNRSGKNSAERLMEQLGSFEEMDGSDPKKLSSKHGGLAAGGGSSSSPLSRRSPLSSNNKTPTSMSPKSGSSSLSDRRSPTSPEATSPLERDAHARLHLSGESVGHSEVCRSPGGVMAAPGGDSSQRPALLPSASLGRVPSFLGGVRDPDALLRQLGATELANVHCKPGISTAEKIFHRSTAAGENGAAGGGGPRAAVENVSKGVLTSRAQKEAIKVFSVEHRLPEDMYIRHVETEVGGCRSNLCGFSGLVVF